MSVATAIEGQSVGKRRGRPETGVPTETVRLRSDIMEKARYIAVERRVYVGQLISDLIAPVIEREYRAFRKRMGQSD